MKEKLIIDGSAVYEVDLECLRCKQIKKEDERKKQKKQEIKIKQKKG